jgi:hypothetical protein
MFNFASHSAGPCAIVIDALDSIFHHKHMEANTQLFLSFVYQLTRHPTLLVIGICSKKAYLNPFISDFFPVHLAFRSPETVLEWTSFFTRRNVVDCESLALLACQHGLSLRRVMECFQIGMFVPSRFFPQLQTQLFQTQQEQDEETDSGDVNVPFTLIPTSTTKSDSFFAIGGQTNTKQVMIEALEWPVTKKREMSQFGIKPIRGVLLCGKPGSGKTLLARAASEKFAYTFLSVSVSDLIRGHVGQSEKRVSKLFSLAKTCTPCVLFFDECHTLFAQRGNMGPSGQKVLSQFLIEMDNLPTGVVLLAATNERRMVDKSVLGRFDRVVELEALNTVADLLVVLHANKNDRWDEASLKETAKYVVGTCGDGVTGAVLVQIMFQAGLEADERGSRSVSLSDVENAVKAFMTQG